jgi:hypothetical protein
VNGKDCHYRATIRSWFDKLTTNGLNQSFLAVFLKKSEKHPNPSFRRKPESSTVDFIYSNFLHPGFRRCDNAFFNKLLDKAVVPMTPDPRRSVNCLNRL